jgi:hypothetical protein
LPDSGRSLKARVRRESLQTIVTERILHNMATVIEIEKLALDLPERDRATLIANLLKSLPPILDDEDEGIAEALRRDAELEADPSQAISAREFDDYFRNRRK